VIVVIALVTQCRHRHFVVADDFEQRHATRSVKRNDQFALQRIAVSHPAGVGVGLEDPHLVSNGVDGPPGQVEVAMFQCHLDEKIL
jgi:hypothetical protein